MSEPEDSEALGAGGHPKMMHGGMHGATRGVKTLLGDPKRAVLRLAIPMVVAMSAQTLYNLADAIWVSGCGAEALSAVGYYFPFFILGLSLSIGVGVGASSAIARAIGRHDKDSADAVASHAVVLSLCISVLFATPMVIFTRQVLGLLGADAVMDMSTAYARIMFCGSPLFFFNGLGSSLLRSEGDAKRSMLAILAGALLNVALDPLYIYGFGLGVEGAAYASLTASGCVTIVIFRWLFVKRDTFVTIRLKGFRFRKKPILDIFTVGAPASVAHGSMFIMAVAITAIVSRVGGADGVAVYTTGWRVVAFAILPMLGIATAVTPVTGAAFGAHDGEKLRTAYLYALKIGLVVEGTLALATFTLAPWITRAFTWSPDSARLAGDLTRFLQTIWVLYPAVAFGMVSSSMFQGVGRGVTALGLTLIRTIAFTLPLAWFFGIVLERGLVGVWTGMVVGNCAYAPIAFIWAIRFIARYRAANPPGVPVSAAGSPEPSPEPCAVGAEEA